MDTSLPQWKQTVWSPGVSAFPVENQQISSQPADLRKKTLTVQILMNLTKTIEGSSCFMTAHLPRYLQWVFLGQIKVIPNVTDRNTEAWGSGYMPRNWQLSGMWCPAEIWTMIGWKLHSGFAGHLSYPRGPEEYGGCIPSTYLTYIVGITGKCQMPGLLLRWGSHSHCPCWYWTVIHLSKPLKQLENKVF
jgi:hypothetical protein